MIFKPASRYPADPRAVFILALSVFSGMTALALNAAPSSLEASMPEWVVILWGVLLSAGSLLALIGMIYKSVNGIITEQIGTATVAVTTIFYSAVAINVVGISAIQVIGVILAWGIACAIRWIQLEVLIRGSVKEAENDALLHRVSEEIEEKLRMEWDSRR